MTNPSKAQIAILISVVALVSAVLAWYHATHTKFFFFEVEMRSLYKGGAQVYYDLGPGFNEADSTGLALPTAESMTTVRFPLPSGNYQAIRFDPINHGYGFVLFRDARIIDSFGRVIHRVSPRDFQATHDIPDMQFSDDTITLNLAEANSDPYLTIALNHPLSLQSSKAQLYFAAGRALVLWFLALCVIAFSWLLFVPPGRSRDVLLLLFLIAFAFLFARSRFFAPMNWDEELFVWQGWMVKNGSVPYRDFFEAKPPLIFLINALGLALFGLKDNLIRILPTALALASIFLFYVAMLKRRIAVWLATLLAAQTAFWLLGSDFHDAGLNDSETYGFAFTLIGFSLGSLSRGVATRSRRIALQVASGICLGLAISSKELFLASAIPAWIFAARPENDEKWDYWQLVWSGLGVALVGFSVVAYLVQQSALTAYLNLLRFCRPMAANYCVDIGRFPHVTGLEALRYSWTMLHGQLYNVGQLAFVLPLWGAYLILPRRGKMRAHIIEVTAAAGAVIAGMLVISVGFCFWKHYFLMGTMGLLLFSVLGAEALSHFLSRKGRMISVTALITLAVLFLSVVGASTRAMLAEKHTSEMVFVDPAALQTIEAHSKPGDYILATESPIVYVVANRKSALGVCGLSDVILPYVENTPLRIETLRDDLEKHLPKVCYFAGRMRDRQQIFHELLFDPFLAEHHYVRVSDRLWYLPDSK